MPVASAELLLMLMPLAAVCAILLGRQQQRLAVLKREAAVLQRTVGGLQSLFERAPLGLAMFDRDLRFVRINQLLADLNGAPVADHVGKSVHEMAPDIAAAAEDRLRQVLDTGLPSTRLVFSGTTTAQPGVMHTWRESIFPLLDREHKAQGVVVSLEDITEQQRLADELRHSRDDEQRRSRELECVLHVCPAGMLIASDRACLRVKANPAAERLLRLGRGASASLSAPGVAAFALYAGGREVPVEQLPLQRAATFGDQTWGADMTVRFADGDELRIVVNAVPLHDERGEIIGAVLGFAAADAETAATGLAA